MDVEWECIDLQENSQYKHSENTDSKSDTSYGSDVEHSGGFEFVSTFDDESGTFMLPDEMAKAHLEEEEEENESSKEEYDTNIKKK